MWLYFNPIVFYHTGYWPNFCASAFYLSVYNRIKLQESGTFCVFVRRRNIELKHQLNVDI